MNRSLSRRDFLKLTGSLSGGLGASRLLRVMPGTRRAGADKRNVLIVVFDTLSARHMSLLGYARRTAPNLERLANRAIVYHNHFAAAPWTVPSTASLFTGVLPWRHRAFGLNHRIDAGFEERNLFHAFEDSHRLVYSHNPLVYTFFDQYRADLDNQIPIQRLFLTFDVLPATVFRHDDDLARVTWRRTVKKTLNGGYSYSLFLSDLYERLQSGRTREYEPAFPRGLPNLENDNYFLLEHALDYLGAELAAAPKPFLGYFHFWQPHHPYKTRQEFFNTFVGDPFQPEKKPRHVFAGAPKESRYNMLVEMQRRYDEVIPYVDQEFARFFALLETSGVLEDTWLILTSDHGELFERGILGHGQPVLFDPVIRIPLIIFEPGRTQRVDVRTPTSTVDLLPTLLQVTDRPAPEWTDGVVLPPFTAAGAAKERSIYSMNARENSPKAPLTVATVSLMEGPYKLIYYFGYDKLGTDELTELYDLSSDPEELNNLASAQPQIAREMLAKLKRKIRDVDAPYR